MATNTSTAMSALDAAQNAYNHAATSATTTVVQPWSQELVTFLAMGVLGFSVIALLLATVLLWRSNAPAQQVLRIFGVISIIGFSSLLLVVGYNNEQLTPIVGLFGAIAGYLLGKDTKAGKDD